jgi:hypothetical protein
VNSPSVVATEAVAAARREKVAVFMSRLLGVGRGVHRSACSMAVLSPRDPAAVLQ